MRTAEEILKKNVTHEFEIRNDNYEIGRIINAMKEHAKEVAKEALKNASENAVTKAEIKNHKADGIRRSGGSWRDISVDKQSILNESNIPEL